jgi:HK97 family phage portal protein
MGIIDNIKKAMFGQPTQFKEAPKVYVSGGAMFGGHSRKDNFKSYATEGYQQNAIVYRCVNEIANGAASIPFKVYQGDIELEQHPLISLLNRPNPTQAGVEYFQALYSFLLLSGNSYALASIVGTVPTELYLLRPDRVEIEPSETAIPQAYKYKLNNEVVGRYLADPLTGQSEVKHFKMWNPLDDYLGLSPLMAAAIDLDQHNMIAKHNIGLLTNGARPSGAIVFKPKDDVGNPTQLTDAQRQQISEDLAQRFVGQRNAGKPMFLEGDFDWKEMGMSPRDMDFLQNKHMAAKDIALCFGVPSQLIGIPDSQTYANVQEARLALYEETIIPLAKRVESDLNEWLAPSFGDDIWVQYDIDAIPAMTERRRRIYENVVSAVREGIISRNEARERLGLEPITGGDEVFIAANLFPLGAPEVAQADEATPQDAGKAAYGEYYEFEDGDDQFEFHLVKAESDIDTVPTLTMAKNAERGLELRKEYGRGGTDVGVARAVQLKNRDRLSPDTVRRMHSYFSRHEVDKQAEGFRRGEAGWPSAGLVAWLLWGGDEGQTWARQKVAQLDKERDKSIDIAAE